MKEGDGCKVTLGGIGEWVRLGNLGAGFRVSRDGGVLRGISFVLRCVGGRVMWSPVVVLWVKLDGAGEDWGKGRAGAYSPYRYSSTFAGDIGIGKLFLEHGKHEMEKAL